MWDPHLTKDKSSLENVQKFACQIACSRWDASYDDLLKFFELQTLQERRLHAKLATVFCSRLFTRYATSLIIHIIVSVSNHTAVGPIICHFLFRLPIQMLIYTLLFHIPHHSGIHSQMNVFQFCQFMYVLSNTYT